MYGAMYEQWVLEHEEAKRVQSEREGEDKKESEEVSTVSSGSATTGVEVANKTKSTHFTRQESQFKINVEARNNNNNKPKRARAASSSVDFESVLKSIKTDYGASELVSEFNASKYKETTKKRQLRDFQKFYVPICEARSWDPSDSFSGEKIDVTAAVLNKAVKQSSFTYFTNIKAYMTTRDNKELDEADSKRYKKGFEVLREGVVQTQELPLLLGHWKGVDKAVGSGKIKGGELEFVTFLTQAYFILSRPDELKDVGREVYVKEGVTIVKFSLGKSKVDKAGVGWSCKLCCCCESSSKLGFQHVKLCPAHGVSDEVFRRVQMWGPAKMRTALWKVLELSGVSNEKSPITGRKKYNLYSVRVGGLQQSIIGGLARGNAMLLGRWKTISTEFHYEAEGFLTNDEFKALKWPFITVESV